MCRLLGYAVPRVVPQIVPQIARRRVKSEYDFLGVDWDEFVKDYSKLQVPRTKSDMRRAIHRGQPISVPGQTLL